MKKLFFVIIMLNLYQPTVLSGQLLTSLSARYNDAFVEWEIYNNDDDKGYLTMTWQSPDDWSQWTYRLGEKSGVIKTKWNKDYSQWEVRGDNKIITAQMIWNGDPRQWRITDNVTTIELKSKWANQNSEWVIEDDRVGGFYMGMNYQNDPRDWIIEDDLDERVSLPMKMVIVFLTMFNSVPKK